MGIISSIERLAEVMGDAVAEEREENILVNLSYENPMEMTYFNAVMIEKMVSANIITYDSIHCTIGLHRFLLESAHHPAIHRPSGLSLEAYRSKLFPPTSRNPTGGQNFGLSFSHPFCSIGSPPSQAQNHEPEFEALFNVLTERLQAEAEGPKKSSC